MSRRDELRAVLEDLAEDPSRPLRAWRIPKHDADVPPFPVTLAAWAVDVAARLHDRFGDDVELTVGALRYPSGTLGTTRSSEFVAVADVPLLDPTEVEVNLSGDVEVRSGHDASSQVLITNHGTGEIALHTNGNVTGWVADPSTGVVIGGFAGPQILPLVVFGAEPGETVAVPLLVGAASFDPELGYSVPPGRWAMVVPLSLAGRGTWRTPLLPMTVTS